jgi:acyl transferase domain-containing protein/NADPH:quinone reductase-like Zn-dependent oxidoreductase/acyl carrier protein
MTSLLNRLSGMSSKRLALLALDLQERLQRNEDAAREPIAIIGMACRFPKAPDIEAFWSLLREGREAVTEIPADRWDVDRYYAADPTVLGKMYTRHGSFIEEPTLFDAAFFGISPREARSMDPQQRLLMETAWHAIEDALLPAASLQGSRTGVFMGVSTMDYMQYGARNFEATEIDAYVGTGCAASVASGRLSYILGLNGPSLPVDTACSSSLVAVHLACQSLRLAESDLCIVGGVNLMLLQDPFIYFSRLGALAPDGRCKTFDASADGYGRGEGCGVVILKRLSDAMADGNNVLAVVRGSHVNHDGRSNGLTAPNGLAQEAVVRDALKSAIMHADDVAYVETHGTGTPLGDPIELHALGNVNKGRGSPLLVGSAKTNIGHLEAAAGIAGFIKVVLSLRHREIVPHVNLRRPNPYIDWANIPIEVARERQAFPEIQGRMIAGVSSFGFSGTNAHLVLEAADVPAPESAERPIDRPQHLLCLSAKTGEALRTMGLAVVNRTASEPIAFPDLCYSANTGRNHFEHRLVVRADTTETAQRAVSSWLEGTLSPLVTTAQVKPYVPVDVAFLFSGQGSQYAGMGRELYATHPAFRETIDRCGELLGDRLSAPLTDVLWGKSTSLLDRTDHTQPAIFAIEVALGRLWSEFGVTPRLVMGHSVGEYAAAHLAGVFGLEDGIELVAARGALMQQLCQPGAMLALDCDGAAASRMIAGYESSVSVAAFNGNLSTVISGEIAAIEEIEARLSGTKARHLTVSHAFHSPLMDPMLEAFRAKVAGVRLQPPELSIISNLTGKVVDAAEITNPDYWVRHVREPVRFDGSMRHALDSGVKGFVEVGPRPVLLGMGRAIAPPSGVHFFPSLQPPVGEWARLNETLGALHLAGVPVNWEGYDGPFQRRKVRLPSYPFQRQRFWVDTKPRAAADEAPKSTYASEQPNESDDAENAPARDVPDSIFGIDWIPAPSARTGEMAAGAVLLFADETGVAARLESELRLAGRDVITVRKGDLFAADAPARWVIRPTDVQDYRTLLEQLGSMPAGIVHLWSLDADTDGDPMASQDFGYTSALLLLQSMLSRGGRTQSKLNFVTRGAQGVGENEPTPAFSQAGLWGLGRVVSAEFPTLRCEMTDLDPAGHPDEAGFLTRNLLQAHTESLQAHRNGVTLAARLCRLRNVGDHATPGEAARLEGPFLITGGLGGIGLLVVDWLVGSGVDAIALMGRSAPTERATAAIERWREKGVRIAILAGDVADADQCTALVQQARLALGPLKGVIHAAGVKDDAALLDLDWERCRAVLAPKLAGASNLHRATIDDPIANFVLFSSVSSVLGSPGHGNYAPANATLDAFAAYRRGLGLPAIAINWGPWAGTGMAARLTGDVRQRWDALGIYGSLETSDALDALRRLMTSPLAQVVVISTDWNRFFQVFPVGLEPPFLNVLAAEANRIAPPTKTWLELMERAGQAAPGLRREILGAFLERELAAVLGSPADAPPDRSAGFFQLGMDSLMSVEFRNRLQLAAGSSVALPITLAFDHPNINALVDFFERVALPEVEISKSTEAPQADTGDPIAIIGMACRFPGGASDIKTFWRNLSEGRDSIREVPPERWDADQYYDPDPDTPGKMNTRWGGFVDEIEMFDAAFFGISPREASRLDPQQRMLLETSWRALENANQSISNLTGSRGGVFVGVSVNDYTQVMARSGNVTNIDAYMGVGNALSMVAGRLAHFLGLRGPALSVDTACSSSLVALHLACESLRKGECAVAIAGGVNAVLIPEVNVGLSKARMLAPDGRCKTFDAAADGYVRGEGCGVVVLKRLSDAVRAGDNMVAVVRATAMNHDGRSSGLTVPNADAQAELLKDCLDLAGLAPADIDYVEAHGTGTPLGDPIEIQALARVFGDGRAKGAPLLVGAVKTNIGHLESAAGMAGLIKTALSLSHGEIPATLHQHKLSPYIPWAEIPVEVVDSHRQWPVRSERRRAGISSFGFSGTNAHAILEQAPPTAPGESSEAPPGTHILTVSARTQSALATLAATVVERVETVASTGLSDFCRSMNVGRTPLPYRWAVTGSTPADLAENLRKASVAPAVRVKRQGVAFLFSGQGSQYSGMGKALFEAHPRFRENILHCERLLADDLGLSLTELLWGKGSDRLDKTEMTQPALFALEYSLGSLWLDWGIEPRFVLGHSVGEYAAACIAGLFSLEDALKLVVQRGRLMRDLCPPGAMLALPCSAAEARELFEDLQPQPSIAALNGPRSVVVSGAPEMIAMVSERARQRGVAAQELAVSRAFHSALMEPMLSAFEAVARTVTYRQPRFTLVSNVTGKVADPAEITKPDYWVRHVREPVQFAASIEAVAALGANVFIEVGPRPVLCAMGRLTLDAAEARWLPSLRPRKDDWAQMLETIAELYSGGTDASWKKFHEPWSGRHVDVPVHPFERQRFWPDVAASTGLPHAENKSSPVASPGSVAPEPGHPLLGRPVSTPAFKGLIHEVSLSPAAPTFLDDHRIYSMVVVPGASHLSMVCAALDRIKPGAPIQIAKVAFEEVLVIPDDEARLVQLILTPAADAGYSFEIYSRASVTDGWLLHAAGSAGHGSGEDGQARALAPSHDDVSNRCTEDFGSGKLFYQLMNRQGIQLGRQFQWIERVWRRGGEALGAMRIARDYDSTEDYFVHPGFLDSCFQLMGATLDTRALEAGAYIPIGIETLHFHAKPTGRLYNHVVMRSNEGASRYTLIADLVVFDEQSVVIAEVRGLRIHRAPRSALAKFAQRHLRDSVYGITWAEQPLAEQARDQTGKVWVIFDGAEESVGQGLRHLLEARGARIARVIPGARDGTPTGVYAIDPADPAHYDKLLRTISVDLGAPACIVFGWSLGSASSSAAEIDAALTTGTFALMRLTQALGRHDQKTAPRLVVLTTGAQAIDAGEPVNLSHSAVWGLGRVIANEFPALRCLRLDVSTPADDLVLHAVEHEILAPENEEQVVHRDGKRFVQRLSRSLDRRSGAGVGFEANEPYQLTRSESGIIDQLSLQVATRQAPEQGEVEILVEATGLNFRDVLNALGLYPGDAGPLGGECAGTIVAIGPGVEDIKLGDRVIAIGAGTFNRFTRADARMVMPIPLEMAADEAATIPVAFVTAWLGLVTMAGIKRGDKVLIHAGAGGVGMAAVQLAHHVGAEVHATAGSEAKRERLRSMGVARVYHSRSLDFAAEVLEATSGRGVDVALNSLAGDFISRTVDVVTTGGRFVEIGKNNIWTREHMSAVRPDIDYHTMALDEVIVDHPDEVGDMMRGIVRLIGEGHLLPLPRDAFPITRVTDAFRHLAQAKHVGKVVVMHGDEAMAAGEAALFDTEAAYLITGGLGGLGLALAGWLAGMGVTRIWLLGRRAPLDLQRSSVKAIEELGARVAVVQGDVTSRDDVEKVLRDMRADGTRIAGIFHAAGALDDAPLMALDDTRFRIALDAKLKGALHLEELTRDDRLDHFVLFSSAAAVLGTPGQANYAAANSFLDGFAHWRRGEGRPAISVNWGPWVGTGMAAITSTAIKRKWTAMGISALSTKDSFATLEMLMRKETTQAMVLNVDWAKFSKSFATGTAPRLLDGFVGESTAVTGPTPEWLAFVETLRKVPRAGRRGLLVERFRSHAARVLGLKSADDIDPRAPLNELGLDSLMAVELANQLSAASGVRLRVTQLFDYPTVDALTDFYLDEVIVFEGETLVEAPHDPRAEKPGAKELVNSIMEISEEEVERRLLEVRNAS